MIFGNLYKNHHLFVRLAAPPCPHTPMLKPFLIIFQPRFNIGLGGTGPRNPIHNRGTFLRWTMAVHIRAYLQKKRTRKQTIKDEFRDRVNSQFMHVKLMKQNAQRLPRLRVPKIRRTINIASSCSCKAQNMGFH